MKASDDNLILFQETLLVWWGDHARDYPWRHNRTSYRTVVAEIMLRRTRADQVTPVYESFMKEYPTLEAGACADAIKIKKILKSLGLEWRAENMVAFLREAFSRYGERLPEDVEELRSLPGIGDYVGAAVVCFSGNQNIPLIDTNVVRVLGRIFGLNTAGEARRRRDMRELARKAVAPAAPADYHYALLDFGAKICTAAKPRCPNCPFGVADQCEYYRQNVQ